MPPETIDPAVQMFGSGMMLLSILAGLHVLYMRSKGPVLPYEPRRPVPWGAAGAILALTLLFFKVVEALSANGSSVAVEVDSAHHPISLTTYSINIGAQCATVAIFLAFIAYAYKATMRDLGIASTNSERVRDLCTGAAACLAALAPVFLLQELLSTTLFPEQKQSGHEIMKMVMARPDGTMLVVATVVAVIVAPVCEEIVFRLLFQGWLERWEDERLGWRHNSVDQPQIEGEAIADLVEPTPPKRGVARLAYGWFPILVSATVFGLVHYGYGPEPVPIFVLGLVLGYLYQRSHRLLPSIVTHALFNLFTMIILWRMIYFHS